MAVPLKQKRGESNNQVPQQIKCYQVNVQHSSAATANLMQMISTEKYGWHSFKNGTNTRAKLHGSQRDTEHLPAEKGNEEQQ
jgi:hypothetical protein